MKEEMNHFMIVYILEEESTLSSHLVKLAEVCAY